METHTFDAAECPVGASVHRPAASAGRGVGILYFHGGGLLYGERDDLPRPYIDLITRAGYTLYCFDYPLAPEAPLPRIREAVADCWRWFTDTQRAQTPNGYVLFGRSAGAYLALLLARDIRSQGAEEPRAVMDFYGYCDLNAPFVTEPSRHYAALPTVGEAAVRRLDGAEPVTSGPKPLRFSLYVHARQTGCWAELLGVPTAPERAAHSLSADDVAALPPLFIAASTDDQDVPFKVSKTLARTAPRAKMHTAYYLEHDFDRDVSNPAGRQAYEACLAWLDAQLR